MHKVNSIFDVKFIWLITLLLITFYSVGCNPFGYVQFYPGKKLPTEQVALLDISSKDSHVKIHGVNHKHYIHHLALLPRQDSVTMTDNITERDTRSIKSSNTTSRYVYMSRLDALGTYEVEPAPPPACSFDIELEAGYSYIAVTRLDKVKEVFDLGDLPLFPKKIKVLEETTYITTSIDVYSGRITSSKKTIYYLFSYRPAIRTDLRDFDCEDNGS